jgi:hypothetical protein
VLTQALVQVRITCQNLMRLLIAVLSTAGSISQSTNSALRSTTSLIASSGSNGLSAGSIGGIVGGSLGAIVLIAISVILVLLWRQRWATALFGREEMPQGEYVVIPTASNQGGETRVEKEISSGGLRYPEDPELSGRLNTPM